MRTVRTSLFLLAAAVGCTALMGCGSVQIWSNDSNDEDEDEDEPVVPTEPKTFEGFIGGAFEVNVDGATYVDMEDFYTQELARLPEKVAQAGYDDSWQSSFEAEVGLADLWRNMTVYVSPLDTLGYQGQTRVGESGRFAITLPPDALNHTYKIRANKRIGVTLTRGETVKKICYNFSAVEMSAPFSDESLPIVISNFVSTVTAYECAEQSGGLKVPPSSQPTMLEIGQTKADVTRILGHRGLVVESPIAWCWAFRPTSDSPCAADVEDTTCDCRVHFDDNGRVSSMDDIASAYFDPTGT